MGKLLLVAFALASAIGLTPQLPAYLLFELVSNPGVPIGQLQPKTTSTSVTDTYVYDRVFGIADRIVVDIYKAAPQLQWSVTLEQYQIDALTATNTAELFEANKTATQVAYKVNDGIFLGSCVLIDTAKTTMTIFSPEYLKQHENPCESK